MIMYLELDEVFYSLFYLQFCYLFYYILTFTLLTEDLEYKQLYSFIP